LKALSWGAGELKSWRGKMKAKNMLITLLAVAALNTVAAEPAKAPQQGPITTPERTEYRATSTLAEVRAFYDTLCAQHPGKVILSELGHSAEGRVIPLVILGDPAVAAPQDNGRPAILIVANIHGGEVEGKEALQMFARDLLERDPQGLLKRFTLLLVPVFNVDGNEKISPENRPYQKVLDGVGLRTNGQNLDLNRDFVKLETPEVRALVALFDRWNPFVMADLHTTNGSYHQEPLTWIWGKHPAGNQAIDGAMHDDVFPWMKAYVDAHFNMDTLPYGDFDDDLKPAQWVNHPPSLRIGVDYFSTRCAYSFLDENYAYADFPTRVRACYAFLDALFAYTATHAEAMLSNVKVCRESAQPRLYTAIKTSPYPETLTIKAFKAVKDDKGEVHGTTERMDVTVPYLGNVTAQAGPVLTGAYLFPPGLGSLAGTLRAHGARVYRVKAPARVKVLRFAVESLKYSERPNQGRVPLREIKGHWETVEVDVAGWYAVPLDGTQKIRALLPALLEPESDEGLARAGAFDAALFPDQWSPKPGAYPVVRAEDTAGLVLELVQE
jgi:dipeptidyl-peptidase 4